MTLCAENRQMSRSAFDHHMARPVGGEEARHPAPGSTAASSGAG